jgi:hypothetical protein
LFVRRVAVSRFVNQPVHLLGTTTMHLSKRLVASLGYVVLLVAVSCSTMAENKRKAKCLKTAIAFYKALANPTADTEQGARASLGLSDYRLFGFPALIAGILGSTRELVEPKKVEGTDNYEVPIKFWCEGKDANGEIKKLRRTLLVHMAPNPSSSTGWSVSEFTFRDEKPLTLQRQILTWLLWIFLAPVLFSLTLWVFFASARVIVTVGLLMALPIQCYVSYVCFGTVGGAVIAMAVLLLLCLMVYMMAMKVRQAA